MVNTTGSKTKKKEEHSLRGTYYLKGNRHAVRCKPPWGRNAPLADGIPGPTYLNCKQLPLPGDDHRRKVDSHLFVNPAHARSALVYLTRFTYQYIRSHRFPMTETYASTKTTLSGANNDKVNFSSSAGCIDMG